MKAVRLQKYHQHPVIEDVPEPRATGPFDVVDVAGRPLISLTVKEAHR